MPDLELEETAAPPSGKAKKRGRFGLLEDLYAREFYLGPPATPRVPAPGTEARVFELPPKVQGRIPAALPGGGIHARQALNPTRAFCWRVQQQAP